MSGLVGLREARKAAFQDREGVKLTFTPFFVKAAVDALREHPLLNASVEGTRIIVKKDIHVGIAVALGKTGLVVPVMRGTGILLDLRGRRLFSRTVREASSFSRMICREGRLPSRT